MTGLDPAAVCERLAAAGLRYQPSELRIERREDRWLVQLPGLFLAWFAGSTRGREQLNIQRRVLRLLEERCSFAAPRILFESQDGEFDVRTMVPGSVDAWSAYHRLRDDDEYAFQAGSEIGAMLAQQHSRIAAADASSWLPHRPEWPEPREWIRERLPRVIDDAELMARAYAVIDAYEHVPVDEADRVLVHTDVGFHNLAIDSESGAINGIFDYDAAAWADRHHDFRYLVLECDRHAMFEGASSTYEAITGITIRRDRVLLYNAASAVSYLAFRAGKQPDERWCGRILEEDLRWSRQAIACALGTL